MIYRAKIKNYNAYIVFDEFGVDTTIFKDCGTKFVGNKTLRLVLKLLNLKRKEIEKVEVIY